MNITSLTRYALCSGHQECGEKIISVAKYSSFVIRKVPSLLEYYSYLLHFQGVLCGPFFHYSDYADFVEGTNFIVKTKVSGEVSDEILKSVKDNSILELQIHFTDCRHLLTQKINIVTVWCNFEVLLSRTERRNVLTISVHVL